MLFARVPLEFKHPPPPDWDGALGCDSAVEENGYPLGSDSSVSTLFAVRVCGLSTALIVHCWLFCRRGRIVGGGGASPAFEAFDSLAGFLLVRASVRDCVGLMCLRF